MAAKPNWHLDPLPRDSKADDSAETAQYLRELIWCSLAVPARLLEHASPGAELARIQGRLEEIQGRPESPEGGTHGERNR